MKRLKKVVFSLLELEENGIFSYYVGKIKCTPSGYYGS